MRDTSNGNWSYNSDDDRELKEIVHESERGDYREPSAQIKHVRLVSRHDSQQNNSRAGEIPIDSSDKSEEINEETRQESTEVQTAKPLLESLAESSSESNESDMSEGHIAMRHV